MKNKTEYLIATIKDDFETYFQEFKDYSDPNSLTEKSISYFKKCKNDFLPITVSGLALALNLTRPELLEKIKENSQESKILSRSLTICEKYAEQELFTGKNPSSTIFSLKNFGWNDKKEISSEVSVNISLTRVLQLVRENSKPILEQRLNPKILEEVFKPSDESESTS